MTAAVIFDFDGTIIDTESAQYSSVDEEFQRHGVSYSLELFKSGIGSANHRHWTDVLQELVGPLDNLDEIQARRLKENYRRVEQTNLRDGVLDVIEMTEQAGLGLSVASSSPSSWVEHHLNARGLRKRFSNVSTRDFVENGKPWPDVFLHAAEQLQVDPADCVVIEDSLNGVLAAKAAGMTCVVVPNAITADADFSKADLVLDSLLDFPVELLSPPIR